MGLTGKVRLSHPTILPAGAWFDAELGEGWGQSPPPVDPPPPAGGVDQFELASAVGVGGADVRSWPITTAITRVDLLPQGFHVEFSKREGPGRWPDKNPDGWAGAIQYTLWIGTILGRTWHLAACVNVDFDNGSHLYADTATEPAKYPRDLWYLDPALAAHTPRVDELTALLVTAGALRGLSVITVQERSQVVVVPFPPASGRSFHF
jgi:hypothetical protein